MGEGMIFIHFTPSRKTWSDKALIQSTGNIERIQKEGLRQFSSVCHIPDQCEDSSILEKVYRFSKHARRNNRKGLWGRQVFPACIVFVTNVAWQPGYDGEYHVQINEEIPIKDILGWFEFSDFLTFQQNLERVLKE